MELIQKETIASLAPQDMFVLLERPIPLQPAYLLREDISVLRATNVLLELLRKYLVQEELTIQIRD